MHRRVSTILAMALAASVSLLPASAARGQALVVSVRSADSLLADAQYLISLAAGAEQARQFDSFVKGLLAAGGETGVEMGKPFGLYMHWPKGLVENGFTPIPVVGFLPVSNEKKLMQLLPVLGFKVKKSQGETYRVDVPGGMPLFVRFARRHAFVALDSGVLRGTLADPATFIPSAAKNSLLYASLRMDRIPREEKERMVRTALGAIFPGGVDNTARLEGETPEVYKARMDGMRQFKDFVEIPLQDSKELTLRLDVDQKRHHLALALTLVPVAGSRLAAIFQHLGKGRSRFAGMAQGAKLSAFTRIPSFRSVPQKPAELVDDLENLFLPRQRPLMRRIIKAVLPLNQLDEVDFGVAFHTRPSGWTWTAGVHVINGRKMEGLLREIVKDLPAVERQTYRIKWNHAVHAGTRIHRARIPFTFEAGVERNRTIYLAVRDDLVVASTGVHVSETSLSEDADTPALDALKEALDRIDKPSTTPTPLLKLDVAPGWMISMIALIGDELKGKSIPASWHKMIASGDFSSVAGKALGSGIPAQVVKALDKTRLDTARVTLTLEGGKVLRLRLDLHTEALKLFLPLQAAFQGRAEQRLPEKK
jgi:hypothetical protein